MRRVALVFLAAAYWLALLVATITATALGEGSRLLSPLYALCLLAALVLALAVLRWPPRPRLRQSSPAVGAARPPRPRSAGPAWPPYQSLAEVTQLMPPVVVGRAPEVGQVTTEASPVAVAEQKDGQFSEGEFRAWADGKREGIQEGRRRALEELGLFDDEDPGR